MIKVIIYLVGTIGLVNLMFQVWVPQYPAKPVAPIHLIMIPDIGFSEGHSHLNFLIIPHFSALFWIPHQ